MKVDRVVLDTNVLISAALSSLGKPFASLAWVRRNAMLVSSKGLVEELSTRLARPRFSAYLDPAEVAEFLAAISEKVEIVEIGGQLNVCRDPSDDMVLETAVTGLADCIVTGDQDLLVLDPFRNIRILTPATFLAALAAEDKG
jgi:putative PIN family toxin of toxin-antitoxin system